MLCRPSIIDVVADSKLQYFKQSFESLKKQSTQDFELVLVASDNDWLVYQYILEQDYDFDLTFIKEPYRPPGWFPARATANNLGLQAARGDIYIGTQDDVVYPPNWVESHIGWQSRSDGPWFVYNRIENAIKRGTQKQVDEFWERISNPKEVAITSRWQYASGHAFSLPMDIAKTLHHREEFNHNWGFEDIAWAYDCHRAGCKFAIDTDVIVKHLDHGDDLFSRRQKGLEDFFDWIKQRSINRYKFKEIYGFDPEYGV